MEVWKKISGYNLYEASNLGRIKTYNWKNKGKESIMKPAHDRSGYLRTMLKRDIDGKFCTVKVHRIIAETFLSLDKTRNEVNHINGIKDDNRVDNLEWCNHSENLCHSYSIGTSSNKGEKNPAATITDKEVLEIRAIYPFGRKAKSRGEITKRELAEKYGVTISCIKGIVIHKTWRHLL